MLELLSTVPADASPYEKVKAAYEFVIITAEYDMESENSQNIRGVFLDGRAGGGGYQKAFQYLMDQMGIWCRPVDGFDPDGNRCGWNVVCIDGVYTFVDTATADHNAEVEGKYVPAVGINYDYLCFSADQLPQMKLVPDEAWAIPECGDTAYDFYRMNGCYFERYSPVTVSMRLWDAVEHGRRQVYFKFSEQDDYLKAAADLFPTDEKQENLINEPLRYNMEVRGLSEVHYIYNMDERLRTISG